MIIKLRPNSITAFLLLFIALFLIMGIAGIGIILLEQYAGITIIITPLEIDSKAFYTASSFIGVCGLFTSSLMIYLMQERRDSGFDTGQRPEQLDFANRRYNSDRCSVLPEL
jgi:hypothetical protein